MHKSRVLCLCVSLLVLAGTQVWADPAWDIFYNSGGSFEQPAQYAGTPADWGEWVVGCVAIADFCPMDFMTESFAFPCTSPDGAPIAWIAWPTYAPGPPPGPPETAHWSEDFAPGIIDDSGEPASSYTTFDVFGEFIGLFHYQYLAFGYRNPGTVGLIDFNGQETWSWREGAWQSDSALGRTALVQVMGDMGIIPVGESSWSRIKSLY